MKRNSGPKTGLNGDVDSDEGGGGGGGAGGMKGVAATAAACAHNPTCGSGFGGKDTEVENVAGAARVALCSHS